MDNFLMTFLYSFLTTMISWLHNERSCSNVTILVTMCYLIIRHEMECSRSSCSLAIRDLVSSSWVRRLMGTSPPRRTALAQTTTRTRARQRDDMPISRLTNVWDSRSRLLPLNDFDRRWKWTGSALISLSHFLRCCTYSSCLLLFL